MVRRNMTRPKLRPVKTAFLLMLMAAGGAVAGDWITHADAGDRKPVVLHFRRVIELVQVPRTVPVEVTADNRFILYVNGRRGASGPSTGTIEHWRVSRIDLAPWLHAGRNVVAAVVWNFGEAA